MATKSPRFKARSGKRRPHLTLTTGNKNKSTGHGKPSFSAPEKLRMDVGTRPGAGNTARPGVGNATRLVPRLGTWLRSRLNIRLGIRAKITVTVAVSLVLVVAVPAATALLLHQVKSGAPASAASSSASAWNETTDAAKTISVYNLSDDHVLSVPLNQYILNVLSAQMAPTAPMASLQAASVVIRTYAVKAMAQHKSKTGTGSHKADVTTSGVNDLQWLTDAQQQSLFGSRYAADISRLRQAVSSTDGLILSYNSSPIDAFLTKVSAGATRSGKSELSTHPAYLPSIPCPADLHSPDFQHHFSFTKKQLANMLNTKSKQIVLKAFRVKSRDKQGYSTVITDGSRTWTGDAFASALGLPSSALTLHVTGSSLGITTKGVGNGYGISLYQAQAWAKSGKTWQEILHTFYPGAKINPSSM